MRRVPGLRRLVREALAIYGVGIPPGVEIGSHFSLMHRGVGTVIHPKTVIGDRVFIFHGVTIGRVDAYRPGAVGRIIVEDDVMLCPGAVVLAGERGRTLGQGSVLGANSVLLEDMGPWEIWAGSPARRVGVRDRDELRCDSRPRLRETSS